MLTLYHAPFSRSTRIVGLLQAMGKTDEVDLRCVMIPRQDGSGGRDPSNPHPEGKVPLLVHDKVEIWESAAIILYLTDLFPDSGLGVPPGDPQRGRYLSWLAWYAGVFEPVMVLDHIGLDHPVLDVTFRGKAEVADRLATALADGPWLMGKRYTAADLLLASPYHWFPDAIPDNPLIRDWVARAADQPWRAPVTKRDEDLMAA